MKRKSFVIIGAVLLVVGFLLFVTVVLNLPSGYWSPGLSDIRWYKMSGVTVENEEFQITVDPLGKDDPTSSELTRLALKADPSFFYGCPAGRNISLVSYEKFYSVARTFTQKYEDLLVGSLVFKVTPNLSNSMYGYLGALASLFIGLLLVRKDSSKTKQCVQQPTKNSVKPDKVSLQPKQEKGQAGNSKRTGDTPELPLTPERKQVLHLAPENICSKCGYAGLPKDRFCRKCGNPLK